MRGNVIAIIALVFFVILAGVTGYLSYKGYTDCERREGEPQGLRPLLERETAARKAKEADLVVLNQKLEVARAAYQVKYEEKLKEHFNLVVANSFSDAQKTFTAGAVEWRAAVEKTPDMSSKLVQPVETEVADRIKAARKLNDDQREEIVKRIKELAEETARVKQAATKEIARLNAEKVRLGNEISAASGEIERLISREPLATALPPAGRVLAAAADTKVAVVNLGTRVGVKRGMRFEVYQVRYGNRRVHKGYLEVKSAEPEVSTCSILFREVRLPRCPICNYTAEQPEEQYCPRCTAPGSPQAFQRLAGTPKVLMVGQSETDPIVIGDLLYNPLFCQRAGTRFAIVGEPLLAPIPKPADDRETKRMLDHLRSTVEFYGGKLVTEVNAETDVLIALRGAKDSVNRAEEMGIPVIREFEIFRYLEK
jgi:adenylate kinase family enzyme